MITEITTPPTMTKTPTTSRSSPMICINEKIFIIPSVANYKIFSKKNHKLASEKIKLMATML